MDSLLGKALAAIVVLLAIFGAVVVMHSAREHDRASAFVAAVSSTELTIKSNYFGNPAGYSSLSNATVLSSGEAPQTIIRNGALVTPWGQPLTIKPIDATGAPATGSYAPDFQMDIGSLPTDVCAKVVMGVKDLIGVEQASTEFPAPTSASDAAAICAPQNSVSPDINLQFGNVALSQPRTTQNTSPQTGCPSATDLSNFENSLNATLGNITNEGMYELYATPNAPLGFSSMTPESYVLPYFDPGLLSATGSPQTPWGASVGYYPSTSSGDPIPPSGYSTTYADLFGLEIGNICQSACVSLLTDGNLYNAQGAVVGGQKTGAVRIRG